MRGPASLYGRIETPPPEWYEPPEDEDCEGDEYAAEDEWERNAELRAERSTL